MAFEGGYIGASNNDPGQGLHTLNSGPEYETKSLQNMK